MGMIVATVLAAGTACGNTVKGTEKPWGPLSTTATPHLPSGSRASINHTLDVFVRNGVERRDPAKAYAVASSMMHIGQTRKQWNQGTLPVPPYRTKGTEFHGYTVMSASHKQVYLTMILQPRNAKKNGAVAYNIRLSKAAGGGWLIDWFTPSAFFAAKGQTPKLFAEPDLGAVAGCRVAEAQEPRQPDHVGCAGAADDPAGGHGRVLLRSVRLARPLAQTAGRRSHVGGRVPPRRPLTCEA